MLEMLNKLEPQGALIAHLGTISTSAPDPPMGRYAQHIFILCRAMFTTSLTSLVNIHQAVLY